jgi:predicted transposase/invertase (TIGR01784 family)
MSSIRLVNDIVFKAVFAKEENKPILICLLNALLELRGDNKIKDITILNPFIAQDFLDDKLLVLDIKAKDTQNRLYNIEVQINPPQNYVHRAILYLSKLFVEQIGKGEDYIKLPRTIGISIIDSGIIFKNTEELHNIFRFKNTRTNLELTNLLELDFIELDKFKKDKPFELSTRLEKWLFLLKFAEYYKDIKEKIPQELQEEEGIPMAIESYQRVLSDQQLWIKIVERDIARMDRNTFIAEAKQIGLKEGKEEGIKEGIKEGMKEGIKEGMKEGMKEGIKESKNEIAKEMLKNNEPIEKIIKYTGLDGSIIDQLKNQLT